MLPTLPPGGEPAGGEGLESAAVAAIRAGVIGTLGRPGDLYQVTVSSLWAGRYRVNVWAGPDAASARVVHSYFVTAAIDGAIVSTVPKITKQYP